MKFIMSTLFLTVMMLCGIATVQVLSDSIDPQEFVTIEVKEGDSIWEYSKVFNDFHDFTSNEFTEWVEKENDLDGNSILVGDKILIPVKINAVKDIEEVNFALYTE